MEAAEMDFFPYITSETDIFLANGTDGKIDEKVSIPYPYPFVVIAGVDYQTTLSSTKTQSFLGPQTAASVSHSCEFFDYDIVIGITSATP